MSRESVGIPLAQRRFVLPLVLAAFALGLASVPHCALMCGPLAAYAGCGRGSERGALYHGARLAVLVSIAALAGAFGEEIVLRVSGEWARVTLSVLVGLALLMAAVRALRLHLRGKAGDEKATSALVTLRLNKESEGSRTRATSLGALTPILPCAATWSLWMLAVGSASPVTGAALAVAFFIPTALGVHLSATAARRLAGRRRLGQGAFAVLFAFGALMTLLRPFEAIVAMCTP